MILDLIEHFKDVIKEFNNKHKNKNICTDYPTMHKFLLEKNNIEWKDGNQQYWHLTHKAVPSLEKKNILKRYKLFDGTYVFMINKNGL